MAYNEKLLNFTFDFEALDECPLCEGKVMIPNGKIRWLDMDFWYVICPVCGLKFMNPRPTKESYTKFYKDYFWQQKVRNLGFRQEEQMWQTKRYRWDNDKVWDSKEGRKSKIEKHRALRFEVISQTLADHITLDNDTHILEIGAGFGAVLDEIHKQYGCHVYAIEPSLESREVIKEFGTIKLVGEYAEGLRELSDTELKFNAIVFSHALENTTTPFQIMEFAKGCLKKNGVIYIQCSNLFTFDQMNPYHPYIFSEHTFRVLAGKLGLKLKRYGDPTHRMLTVTFSQ